MASNHTANYGLSQWERSDKVLMEDFNADNAKIDAAVKAVDQRVDGKADASDLTAETNARKTAVSALNTAVSKLGSCRVERFTVYDDGDSSTPVYLNFSAKPVVFLVYVPHILLVCHGGNSGERTIGFTAYYMMNSGFTGTCTFTWSGTRASTDRLDPQGSPGAYNVVAFYDESAK